MPRLLTWLLISLLALAVLPRIHGQESEFPLSTEPLSPPAVVTPEAIDAMPSIATPSPYEPAVPPPSAHQKNLNDIAETRQAVYGKRSLTRFWGYRTSESSMSWTIGNGEQFSSFSLDPEVYQESGKASGFNPGFGVRFLSGPIHTDMPPRVFEFSLGYQKRDILGDFAYDVSTMVRAASDFEGSARDGIRFPAHAVGYFTLVPRIDLVFGIDYLDRGDIHLLPVGGLLLRPDPDIRIELVFPRPRIDFQLTNDYRFYVRGGLVGGTWAVERDSGMDDLASLYELQAAVGLARANGDSWSALEISYLFDRKLEFSSGLGDYQIDPTAMIRIVTRF